MRRSILNFSEYDHIDPENGSVYHPYFVLDGANKGKWMLHGWPITINELGWLCNIPEKELLMLRLKYGG